MLEWEESTFLGLKSLYQRWVKNPRERRTAEVRAELKDHRQALFVLAQLIAGKPVAIFETDGPYLCDPARIFLPAQFSAAPTRNANVALFELKTILGALAIRNRWQEGCELNEIALSDPDTPPNLPDRIGNLESQFGAPEEMWTAIGKIRGSGDSAEAATVNFDDTGNDATDQDADVTEIEGRGQLDVTVQEEAEDDGAGADLPIHTFEKAETLEEYTGLSRKSDDEDELEDHAEALRDTNMNRVLRSRDRPSSIYRADVLLESPLFEAKDNRPKRGIPYPEWDFKRRTYRPDWCFVQEEVPGDSDPEWASGVESDHHALILDLKKKFAHLATEWLRAKRQPAGDEFDIEALVDNQVQWRSGTSPDENVYLHRNRDLHDVAALILLDRSFSTDGYIDGKRVLDIIRETIFCAGEVMSEFVEDFGIAAFSSNTRHHCAFQWVKNFSDPWEQSRSRLGSLNAQGYTRIGPALRHAQEALTKRNARRRVIILVTDGRPCDYDRYEGTYGIKDVKMALETGRIHGIDAHAFAIEKRAKEFFPAMFTSDHFSIVPSPNALTKSLCDLFAKLRAQ